MMTQEGQLKICDNGHQFYKSSDCPTCPICERDRKPESCFLSLLAGPARRALENNGVTSLKILSTYSEKEVLKFYGMGPASLPKLKLALEGVGLSFRSE
ncbi:RNA polymerase alpha subunit C-terminal domain-containing protein [Jeotgalibacillus proteolyticus]|uniref:RNA polymerase alpha subunit C-terminal domain-containing protein n=1 Tax=Jeotgalibacillus proteolyticus TaxID=2082395 RepID=UPI003CE7E4F2